MVSINPNSVKRLQLTKQEQRIILQNSHFIDKNIYDRILNSPNGAFHLLDYEINDFRLSLSHQLDLTTNEEVKEVFAKIFNKLSTNPVISQLAEELTNKDFSNVEELNKHIKKIYDKKNDSPDSEMGNLSPNQITRLVYSSWDDQNFPIKFNRHIGSYELEKSQILTNTKIFLKNLTELKNENTATATGNLSRKVVKIMFNSFEIDKDYKETTLRYNKVLNEEDVFPLNIIRIVCEIAGIIKRKSKKFYVVKKYHDLFSEENAGKLFYLLFETYFRKFNIGYGGRLPELNGIQATIAYSLYRLNELAGGFVSIEKLKDEIFLPAVKKEIKEKIVSPHIKTEWIMIQRIIEPLEDFGLLECKKIEKYRGQSEIEKVRKTELFDKFMKFEV